MIDTASVEALAKVLRQEPQDTNNKYDAIVSRIDNEDVIWVNLAGSDIETPTASTSSEVKQGDHVVVEWRNNKLYISGNSSNPSAGVIRVDAVEQAANIARNAAESAVADAGRAREAAESVEGIARHAERVAESVEGIARDAEASAQQAEKHANTAMVGLSTVENVVGTLKWISEHGDYSQTADTSPISGKTYYNRYEIWNKTPDTEVEAETSYYQVVGTEVVAPMADELYLLYELVDGDYVRTTDTKIETEKTYYTLAGTLVENPVTEDIGTYYELTSGYKTAEVSTDDDPAALGLYQLDGVNEAVSNYVASHLALTDDGLYVISDDTSYKVLITGSGVDIVSPEGVVVAHYGGNISFDSQTEYIIGNEETYIRYYDSDEDGKADAIEIIANSIVLGGASVGNAIETLEEQAAKATEDIETIGNTVGGIATSVDNSISDINAEVNGQNQKIQAHSDALNKYAGHVSIDTAEPSITVSADRNTYIKIVPSRLSLINDNNETAYLSNERLHAPSAVVTNLYMQTVDAVTGAVVAGTGWVMRSNGHLSLRPMK